jgi:hypothetical protein
VLSGLGIDFLGGIQDGFGVTTNANGDDNSFVCTSPVSQPGQTVTATATNTASGNTSEFSQNVGVVPGP